MLYNYLHNKIYILKQAKIKTDNKYPNINYYTLDYLYASVTF